MVDSVNKIVGDGFVSAFTEDYIRIPEYIQDTALPVGPMFLYGVILKWVAIGRKTGMGAFPSREELSTECHASPEAISDWLKKLNADGWVAWKRRSNTSSLYVAFGPGEDGYGAGKDIDPEALLEWFDGNAKKTNRSMEMPKRPHGNAKKTNEQDNSNKINNKELSTPPTPKGDDDGGFDVGDYEDVEPMTYGKGPIQHHPQQAAKQQAPQRNSSVSNQNSRCQQGGTYGVDCSYNTLEEELADPYWKPENVEYFKALIEPYPKHKLGQQHLSMHAWRTVVGELAADQAWVDQYWRGLHNWLMKWDTEKTDPQYIPWFPNFIKNKKWQGTPPPPPR